MLWYLAGPICHVKEGSDRHWREVAKKQLWCLDPFDEEVLGGQVKDGVSPKERFNLLRAANEIDRLRQEMQDILRMDEDSVTSAEGVLAYSPEPTWGTIREVALAYQQQKPVVLWTEAVGSGLSNTLIGLSTRIVPTLQDAIVACKQIEAELGAT